MDEIIHIEALEGRLRIPTNPLGLVLFAHGCGSSRLSPRNNFVADLLYKGQLASLLIDLLSKEEDAIEGSRFDIDLLTKRLSLVVNWIQKNKETKELPLGLFGASTGAASALNLSAKLGSVVKAVVSRGGRPDLAKKNLPEVRSPTLLIVGGNDDVVISLNKDAYALLTCTKKMEIVPNATHLFEEPGCLENVAELALAWFKKFFEIDKALSFPFTTLSHRVFHS